MCVCVCARGHTCVKMVRYNLFLSDKNGGNSFLNKDHDDDEDIYKGIIMLSLACNQVMARC